ncbi:MAG: anthranilate phosphoribosyltransferase [Gemmatimonadetes bacterium]|nr:anthranilate phosphoribosyltransferase [Gemmatimonadota bacterium]MBI3568976.1 anthranilate phosphoribosyltransferase [Gemmatimonadota bacterium]
MSSAQNALQHAVRQLAHGASLSVDEATRAFATVMSGEGLPSQIAALLMALRVKGETADEVAGAARALRDAMTVLEADSPDTLVDTCGTGGGSIPTFNISTAAALLTAGAGARVAKHGNRSFTSKSGSADVIEALGIAIDIPVAAMGEVLERAGIVFMFAPTMHPAMRHVGPVRREIAVPTVMNLIGPLANPARAGRQVIGVADANRLELIGQALAALGTRHSLVVHGEPGLDEISPLGRTTVLELQEGEMRRWTLEPADLGVDAIDARELAGGSPAENAELIEQLLVGKGSAAARSAVLINAAGAIYVAGLAGHFQSALSLARQALREGAGRDALDRLRKAAPRR